MKLLKHYSPIILFILSFSWLLKVFMLDGFPDFTGYYYGARHILQNENPYHVDLNYFTAQTYPPFTLIIFMFLAGFSFDIASKLWVGLSIIAILFIMYLFCQLNKVSFFSSVNLYLCTLVFLSFPLKFTLGMGQVNALILLFIVLVFYFLQKRKNYPGALLAFPIMVKFFPLFVLPYMVLLKKWRLLVVFFVTLLSFIIITFVLVPSSTIFYYFQVLLPDIFSSWKGDYYNQSLTGFLMRNIPNQVIREWLRIIISLAFILFTFLMFLKRKKRNISIMNLEFAAIIILNVLINTFSWQHHFIWLLLPFLVIFFYLYNNHFPKKYFAVIFISYLLVALNFKDPAIVPIIFQSHMFFGGLLLYGLDICLLFKK